MALQKTYQYKIYSSAGTYLGMIPPSTVLSEFGYNQNIATTFAQMQVEVAIDADVAGQGVSVLTDESGNPLTDEAGSVLTIERQTDIVGDYNNAKALYNENNLIKVYEISAYYPNGLLVFSGYISKWKTNFGGSDEGKIILTCLSLGNDMNQLLVNTGDVTYISQATDNGSTVSLFPGVFTIEAAIQTFNVAAAVSIGAAAFEITCTSATAQVGYLLRQQAGTQPDLNNDLVITYGYATPGVITKTVQKISFNQPATLTPGSTYYIEIYWTDSTTLTIFASSTQPYDGVVYTTNFTGTFWQSPSLQTGFSLYFIIYKHGGNVTGTYINDDPTFILQDVMSNYVTNGGGCSIPASTITALISQPLKTNSILGGFWTTAYAQVITPAKTMTFDTVQYRGDIGSTPDALQVQLYRGDPSLDSAQVTGGSGSYVVGGSNALLATSNSQTLSSTVDAAVTLTFASPQTLTGGTQYYLVLFFGQGFSVSMLLDTASSVDTITDTQVGKFYSARLTANNSSAAMTYSSAYPAMTFQLGLGAGSNPAGGYSNTGNITTYTFKMQTVLQAIQAIVALAPANWYWYVDPATNILQFALANTVADITLIRGRHINELDIEATKENVKTSAYFTGGDDGTGTSTNILTLDNQTIAGARIGLALLSDNRVNSTSGSVTTAHLIAQNYLKNNASRTYITNVTLQDGTIDINTVKLGQMVAIAGFGNFVDSLLLQVVGVNRAPDQVQLQLGSLPLRDSKTISDINKYLAYQQTVNTPATPS